ncbi:Putative Gp38 protein from phage [Xenorhabdus bovienii]|uniref:Putative Gp38 protein from phage n=2 Tax=Xenorhabdus bovienii TaxID=40576 RepID=A0A0B6X500_XENBV|nr:Putative Gp38 protein from phage [Xenorhabdus bovienii]
MLSDKKQQLVSESSRQLNALGINHTTDICGTITVQTKQGKVIYYPTKNKIQYKGTVTAGGLNNVKNLVESLGLSGDKTPQKNKPDEMTLRDYFAGLAITGSANWPINQDQLELYAKGAYQIADAMLEARENNNG